MRLAFAIAFVVCIVVFGLLAREIWIIHLGPH